MSDQKLNRREFFKRAALLGAAAAGAGSFLSACQPSGDSGAGGQGGGEAQGQAQQEGGGLNCEDPGDLDPAKVKVRETLKYTDNSPEAGQTCDNCQYYKQPESQGECGGCTIVPGPIHPKGWCSSWKEAA